MDKVVAPCVSVIMPAYNVEKYIGEAIESILNQTYQNFEFLIFNDGSTDNTKAVIESYTDSRIKIFNYSQNKGLVAHLNYGIDVAASKYIARMDADDISHPERLQKQVDYMEANTDIGICGTWYNIIEDPAHIVKIDTKHDDLKIGLLFNSVFGHPTVIIRTEVLRSNSLLYNNDFMHAEDFKLWVELSRISKLANLNEVLLHYRHHEWQVSNLRKQAQLNKAQVIREQQVEYLFGNKLTDEERQMTGFLFGNYGSDLNAKIFKRILEWSNKLIRINLERNIYKSDKFELVITNRIKGLMLHTTYDRSLFFSKSLVINRLSQKDKFKFYLKCIFNWNSNQRNILQSMICKYGLLKDGKNDKLF